MLKILYIGNGIGKLADISANIGYIPYIGMKWSITPSIGIDISTKLKGRCVSVLVSV